MITKGCYTFSSLCREWITEIIVYKLMLKNTHKLSTLYIEFDWVGWDLRFTLLFYNNFTYYKTDFTYYNTRVDSVIESSLGSKIMHLFIWDETFVRWQ